MRQFLNRLRPGRAKTALIAFFAMTVTAIAAIVTANQIAEAIQASSTTPDFMKQNAYLFASMAVNQESPVYGHKGYLSDTTAHTKGSCCYGVMQLHHLNIDMYSPYKGRPEAYNNASLQDQIDYYGKFFADNLKYPDVAWVVDHMGQQFGSNKIDAAMVFSCIQLGAGNINRSNCGKAVRAGKCDAAGDGYLTLCQFANNANRPSNCTDTSVCTRSGAAPSSSDLAGYPGTGDGGTGSAAGGTGGTGIGGTGAGGGLTGTDVGGGSGSTGGTGGIGAASFSPVPQLPRSQGSKEIPILEGKGD